MFAAVIAWLETNILMPILGAFIAYEEPKIVIWITGFFASQAQKAQNDKNVAALKAAEATGDHNAEADAETSVLNGTTPPGPN
jgi:hypothetical protein